MRWGQCLLSFNSTRKSPAAPLISLVYSGWNLRVDASHRALQVRVLVIFGRASSGRSVDHRGRDQVRKHFGARLTTLRLRLRASLGDKRWHWFMSGEEAETTHSAASSRYRRAACSTK